MKLLLHSLSHREYARVSKSVRYRVEHHAKNGVAILGHIHLGLPHPSTLDAFVSRLLHDGAGGYVALIDERSDMLVARRMIKPTRPLARTRPRQRGTSLLVRRRSDDAEPSAELLRACRMVVTSPWEPLSTVPDRW